MTTTKPYKAARFAAEIADANRQAAGYRKLAALAADLGMGYEAERATDNADEMDAEADLLIERAILAGFDCDDIEAA